MTGTAPVCAGEFDECQALARQIGIRHEVLQTDELSNPEYQKNDANRCYHCKTELFVQVEKLCERLGVAVVADGSNRDDHGEHRPGLRAARERKVRSPLAEVGFTKPEIRQLARHWNLPTWDKPATPCLSSRIAYGEAVTAERLAMVDQAERFLRQHGFQPLRVRYHKGDMARIEVAVDAIPRLIEPAFRAELVGHLSRLASSTSRSISKASARAASTDLAGREPSDFRRLGRHENNNQQDYGQQAAAAEHGPEPNGHRFASLDTLRPLPARFDTGANPRARAILHRGTRARPAPLPGWDLLPEAGRQAVS